VVVGPFTVNFPVGTYATDNTYDANPQTLNDMTAEANHMSAVSLTGPLIVPNALGGRAGFTAAALRYFVRTVLTNSRSVSGPMTIILTGVVPASIAGSIIYVGGSNGMRDIRTSDGWWGLVSSVASFTSPNAISVGDKSFLFSGSWNSASSSGQLRQPGRSTVTGASNPGDPATLPLTEIAFGAHGSGVLPAIDYKLAAIFAVDGLLSAGELAYLRDGFAHRYSIL